MAKRRKVLLEGRVVLSALDADRSLGHRRKHGLFFFSAQDTKFFLSTAGCVCAHANGEGGWNYSSEIATLEKENCNEGRKEGRKSTSHHELEQIRTEHGGTAGYSTSGANDFINQKTTQQ